MLILPYFIHIGMICFYLNWFLRNCFRLWVTLAEAVVIEQLINGRPHLGAKAYQQHKIGDQEQSDSYKLPVSFQFISLLVFSAIRIQKISSFFHVVSLNLL